MSDSVTNVDVEDVLSSIRRLVSDTNSDARPAPTPEPEPEPEVAEEKPSDALLLTSALRVPTAEKSPEAADLSNLRGAVANGEDTTSDWPTAHDDEYYEDEEPEATAPVIDFIRHDRGADQAQAADDEDMSNVDEVEAEIEAHTEEPNTEDEVDTSWAPHIVETEDHTDLADGDLPDWIEAGNAEISEAEIVEPNDTYEDASVTTNTREAVAEDMSGAHDEEAFDDPSDEEHLAGPEVIFASAAAASVFTDEDEENATDADPDVDLASDLGDLEEGVLDEDALRDLVAEIVRQELTGDLGERITRNVRKLVRREIHRALLTREFE